MISVSAHLFSSPVDLVIGLAESALWFMRTWLRAPLSNRLLRPRLKSGPGQPAQHNSSRLRATHDGITRRQDSDVRSLPTAGLQVRLRTVRAGHEPLGAGAHFGCIRRQVGGGWSPVDEVRLPTRPGSRVRSIGMTNSSPRSAQIASKIEKHSSSSATNRSGGMLSATCVKPLKSVNSTVADSIRVGVTFRFGEK